MTDLISEIQAFLTIFFPTLDLLKPRIPKYQVRIRAETRVSGSGIDISLSRLHPTSH